MKRFLINILSLFLFLVAIFLLSDNPLGKGSSPDTSWIGVVYSNILEVFQPAKKSLYLVAGGDIMLSRNIGYLAKKEWYDRVFKSWNYNPVSSFPDCTWYDCLLFFNLESLFNEKDNDIPKWWFIFRANPQNIETLIQLRQDHPMILSLANNHTINTTYSWIIQTREILDTNNILWAWAWISTWESRQFAVYEKNWIKICIWAYSYDGQYVKVGAWKMSRNKIDENLIKEDLAFMSETGCDVKILSLHWGSEYRISPNNQQKKLAHSLIDSWADLILWWHSHVPWEFEIYSWKYIFYSFWNFIFDQWWWRRTPGWNYDHIYDYDIWKYTVPTYISLLAWLQVQKDVEWVKISLDKINMNVVTNWLLQPLDEQTFWGILERIDVWKVYLWANEE